MIKYNSLYSNPILKNISSSLVKLPTPANISLLWNFGSLLGMCLLTQILSGIFLAMHYTPNIEMAFQSILHICRDVNLGWFMRIMHANGASMFFICMFIHIGRGIYYESFILVQTWTIGVIIFILTMASAFMGYVLPWGQMSFWGATVITNLMSAVPYIGQDLVYWIWGGFSVENATLNRFFVFHFLVPFIVLLMVIFHLFFLHISGSNNPMGLSSNSFKISFHPFFSMKDLMGFVLFFIILMMLVCFFPYKLGDPDNFMIANPMTTPIHIKPEWYFLFAYAILRSIPNKLGGVIALLMSISILFFMPFLKNNKYFFKGSQFKPFQQMSFWMFISIFFLLTWIGAQPVEIPYTLMSQILTILYFLMFYMISFFSKSIFFIHK